MGAATTAIVTTILPSQRTRHEFLVLDNGCDNDVDDEDNDDEDDDEDIAGDYR